MDDDSREETLKPQTLEVPSTGDVSEEKLHSVDIREFMIRFAKMIPQSDDHKYYAAFSNKKIVGLIDRGVFMHAGLSDDRGHCSYGSRFVDFVKNKGTPDEYEKFRSIIQSSTTSKIF